jgi:hypothetical protein
MEWNINMEVQMLLNDILPITRGEEGGGGQQMSPEFLNKAFSTKYTQYMC